LARMPRVVGLAQMPLEGAPEKVRAPAQVGMWW